MLDSDYKMGVPYISIINKAKHSAYAMVGYMKCLEKADSRRQEADCWSSGAAYWLYFFFQKSDKNVLELGSRDDCIIPQVY